jgi:hypothetical protein
MSLGVHKKGGGRKLHRSGVVSGTGAITGPVIALQPTTMDPNAAATSNSQIFSINPYEHHPSLTQIEADVLWEYAKLNQHIKDVRCYHLDLLIARSVASQLETETKH